METINLTVYSYIVLGLIGVVVLLACWVVYLQLSLQQIRKTLFSISDNFNEIDSVINTVKGFSKRWDYVTKALSDLQIAQEHSSVTARLKWSKRDLPLKRLWRSVNFQDLKHNCCSRSTVISFQ